MLSQYMQDNGQQITMKNIDEFLSSLGYVESLSERAEDVLDGDEEDPEDIVIFESRVYRKEGIFVIIARNEDEFDFNVLPESGIFDFSGDENNDRKSFKIKSLKSFKDVMIILSNTDRISDKFNRMEKELLLISNLKKHNIYTCSYKIGDKILFNFYPIMLIDQCFVEFTIRDIRFNEYNHKGFSFLFHIDDNNKFGELVKCLEKVSETMDVSHIEKM